MRCNAQGGLPTALTPKPWASMNFRPSSGRYHAHGTLLSLLFSILWEYGAVKAKTCKHKNVLPVVEVQNSAVSTLQGPGMASCMASSLMCM